MQDAQRQARMSDRSDRDSSGSAGARRRGLTSLLGGRWSAGALGALALCCCAALLSCAADDSESAGSGDGVTGGDSVDGGCAAGSTGCPCLEDGTCGTDDSGAALVCTDGVCERGACEAGVPGCPCTANGTCVGGSTCSLGVCGPVTCALGTCDEGSRCDGGQCVPCTLGSDGCACDAAGCGEGLVCFNHVCVPPTTPGLPQGEPACYSPCSKDLIDPVDGSVLKCLNDQMEGCIGGRACIDGSCLLPGETKSTCFKDLDCPGNQACIVGGCYSNCKTGSDCDATQVCADQVCRTRCSSSAPVCPSDEYCDVTSGTDGACRKTVEKLVESSTDPTDETFTVEPDGLVFAPTIQTQTITITNDSAVAVTYLIHKLDDRVSSAGTGAAKVSAQHSDVSKLSAVGKACAGADCPLAWLTMGAPGEGAAVQELEVTIGPYESGEVELGGAGDATVGDSGAAQWDGTIEVVHPRAGARTLTAFYRETPAGQWVGEIAYFATFNDVGLQAWTKEPQTPSNTVQNALLQRWMGFRSGKLTWDQFQEVLSATEAESWLTPKDDSACASSACYATGSTTSGLAEYSTDLAAYPIPTGVVTMPIAMNLLQKAGGSGKALAGRIESSIALHYGGNPAVELVFGTDPSGCDGSLANKDKDCAAFVKSLSAKASVGGRYVPAPDDLGCATGPYPGAPGFTPSERPWLVPGFAGASLPDADGVATRTECLAAGAEALALANPVPDGLPRIRTLELVDGALINSKTVFVFFRERFNSFLGPEDTDGFSGYGYMRLTRTATELDEADEDGDGTPDAYEGTTPEALPAKTSDLLGPACSPELVPPGTDLSQAVFRLVEGTPVGPDVSAFVNPDEEHVHYLCEATGNFDGGATEGSPEPCPAGGKVTFFTVDPAVLSDDVVRGHACQSPQPFKAATTGEATMVVDEDQRGQCQTTFNGWRAGGKLLQDAPVWKCHEKAAVFCDDLDRLDMRLGKDFYAAPPADASGLPPLKPLLAQIDDAFRYKTQFKNRVGTSVGFSPEICVPDSDQIPYCYDPEEIVEVQARTECLLDIWGAAYDELTPPAKASLNAYLKRAFSYTVDNAANLPVPELHDGFEHLNAELLIMLGDESYTRAFASRFDLSASHAAAFAGTRFETNGIDLGGTAGYEMYSLHQAAQLYGLALDRFYALSPTLYAALQAKGSQNFVTVDTAIWYFDKLIGASTQLTATWSEIAKRYVALGRPDLARRVIERAYTGAYLESVVLARMMLRLQQVTDASTRDQLIQAVSTGQRRYRVALVEMKGVYDGITNKTSFYGVEPDFVPLPSLQGFAQNGFAVILERAQNKLALAKQREEAAIANNSAYNFDQSAFESELTNIKTTYENQLADLCGTFEGDDGVVYPATQKYAHLSAATKLLGDPCGLVGTGQIHKAAGEVEVARIEQQEVRQRIMNTFEQVDIETERISKYCQEQLTIAKCVYDSKVLSDDLQSTVDDIRVGIGVLDKANSLLSSVAQLQKNESYLGAISGAAVAGILTVGAVAIGALQTDWELQINGLEDSIRSIDRNSLRWQTEKQCDLAVIDSNAKMAEYYLNLKSDQLAMLKGQRNLALQASDVVQLLNQAQRLQTQQEAAEQLAINAAAARNDPNSRIFKNDAIINAEISFDDAMREAYKATLVFEYYTSQSYAKREQLYLVRMISHGTPNLENYLTDLQNAYFDFDQIYGTPDPRVAIVSLRDDILQVDRYDAEGNQLLDPDRTLRFRAMFKDASHLDENGYRVFAFKTDLSAVSPLTRVHKVVKLQADIIGSGTGDRVARLYVRQRGTGTILGVAGDKSLFRLPVRTAVLNPFFGGAQLDHADAAFYDNDQLRERPFANTEWELVFNGVDEEVNKDIDIDGLSDIKLYVFYSDFTAL